MAENVRVAVRVRPFNSRETARKASVIIKMTGTQTEITDPENTKEKPKKFAFDFSYWSHDGYSERDDGYLEPSSSTYADQKVVFDDLGKGVLDNAWKGYNCSLFAYGQTGSGKSYSMVGYGTNKGIVPLACEDLFRGINEKKTTAKEGEEYQVKLSMLEIYNEQVRDLLNLKSSQKGGLKVRQHPSKGFYVDTLTSWPVDSYMAIDNKINEGTRNRTVASTNMNATSSRAHTIVAVTFVQKTLNEANQNMTKTSIINLVDLAGSERAESTGATGDRLKEGSAINQSLSTLGNCIKALADLSMGKKKTVVPFRDSVLTKLLQNALGGNSKTIMIAALSPADINYEETLSTLRFADRAKAIKTQAVVNESPTDKLIRELREENARLMEMLKGGGGANVVGTDASTFNREEEMERLRKELEEQMKESQMTWAQKLEEANQASKGQAEEENQIQARRKTECHFWNLNEDPALTAMVIHFVKDGKSTIGTKNASPPPDIQLNGLSIQKEHAVIENKNNIVTLTPTSGSRILINGESVKDNRILHHHDRVLFGSNHLYAFQHPHDESKQKEQGVQVASPTYDSAQEEIMKHTGLFKDTSGGDGKSKEDLLLQEDLIQLLPMVNEANAMSEELDKKVKFEIALVSPQARGLPHGRTEVNVKMRNLVNGNEWMFDRNHFINRKFLMQEMYQNFMEGCKDWDVERLNFRAETISFHVKQAVREKIHRGEFVDMRSLLPPENQAAQESSNFTMELDISGQLMLPSHKQQAFAYPARASTYTQRRTEAALRDFSGPRFEQQPHRRIIRPQESQRTSGSSNSGSKQSSSKLRWQQTLGGLMSRTIVGDWLKLHGEAATTPRAHRSSLGLAGVITIPTGGLRCLRCPAATIIWSQMLPRLSSGVELLISSPRAERKKLNRRVSNIVKEQLGGGVVSFTPDPLIIWAGTKGLHINVYLQSLGYMIELQENLAVTDFKGVEQAHLNVEILPCSDDWTECCDEFTEDPGDLLSRALHFKLKIISGRGIANRFIKSYCRYKFYLDENWVETETISGTSNPDFDHEKRFTFKPVTQQLLDYLLTRSLVIEVWGQQKPDKSEVVDDAGKAAKKSEKTSKGDPNPAPAPAQNTTKALMSREKTTLGVGATAANTVTVSKEDKIKEKQDEEAKYKAAHEINTYKKIAERAENRLNQLQGLIQGAKVSGDGTIKIADLEALIAGSDARVSSSPSASSNGSSSGRHIKRSGEKQGSSTCSLQ
ncbi:kinesin-like protein KIF28P [Haliotis rubra]|uniref:kinesin-like protein KIF28P n=1 Tax=Haliotis rubra TaxID=36100 RepID=UPI001EE5A949|nr:kinesin-like protein KIF28P [Haliotis rubra]